MAQRSPPHRGRALIVSGVAPLALFKEELCLQKGKAGPETTPVASPTYL